MLRGDIDNFLSIFFFFFFFISVNSFTCLSTLLRESISLTDSLKNVFDQYFHIPDPIFFLLCLKIYQLTIISFFLNIVVFIIFLRIFGNIWYYLMIFLISIILKKPHYIMRLPERQLAHFAPECINVSRSILHLFWDFPRFFHACFQSTTKKINIKKIINIVSADIIKIGIAAP